MVAGGKRDSATTETKAVTSLSAFENRRYGACDSRTDRWSRQRNK
ncbi:unnamed protein product [Brassica oleracea]